MQGIKTWSDKNDKDSPKSSVDALRTRLQSVCKPRIVVTWGIWFLLLWYIKASSTPMERFDPFEILQIPESSTEADIKKAYRKLSLQYHPDKNPDPGAADYFAQYITKAYKALTDEVSRENYKKYGHPDGPQATDISVALPEWFFSKDKGSAPAILLSLLLGGIVLPLGLSAWYLGRSHRYVGPNEVMMETVQWYLASPYAIKQYQQVSKMVETMVCAMEFLPPHLAMPGEQGLALDQLCRLLVPHYPELKDRNSPFYKKRHPALVKAHLLVLAHLARVDPPPQLKKDFAFILQKSPRLIQEMFAVSSLPRVHRVYGWLTPAIGCVELMQCIIRAVPVDERHSQKHGKQSNSSAALLQLPHMTDDIVRTLIKKKIKSLDEFMQLGEVERRVVLQGSGLVGREVDDVEAALSALPKAHVTARLEDLSSSSTSPNEGVGCAYAMEDVVTCTLSVIVTRHSHCKPTVAKELEAMAASKKGLPDAPKAFTPSYPFPRDEHWFCVVGDPASGALMAWTRVSLLEAEFAGARTRDLLSPSPSDIDERGQKIELKFLAPPPGKHDLVVYVLCDSWIGAGVTIPLKLKTIQPTRAQREGRVQGTGQQSLKQKQRQKRTEKDDEKIVVESEEEYVGDEGDEGDVDEVDVSDEEDGFDDEEESDEGDHDWDSDEYGTEESEDEEVWGKDTTDEKVPVELEE